MKKYLSIVFLAAAVLLLLTAAGCELPEIDLPPLPTPLSQGTASDVATPGPVMPSTPEPPVPPPPTPEPTAEPTIEPTADPLALIPPPLSLDAPEASSEPVSIAPKITLRDETRPTDMVVYHVQDLLGWIEVDCGVLTEVAGSITNSSGETVQECVYYPMSWQFSLAGTVNAQLTFASLPPDTYTYSVTAKAEYGRSIEDILLDCTFTVYPEGTALRTPVSDTVYAPKLTDDPGVEGQIWNFFITEFKNPYAAAAILANVYAESGCCPVRLQGDTDENAVYSDQYTAQVDSGAIDRAGFVSGYCAAGYGPGYGLCQWSGERRGTLYDMAQARGTSVGDTETQCFVIMYELTYLYPDLLETLSGATDASTATLAFCNEYEQPYLRSGRTALARQYLEQYAA